MGVFPRVAYRRGRYHYQVHQREGYRTGVFHSSACLPGEFPTVHRQTG